MNNIIRQTTEFAHHIISAYLPKDPDSPGCTVIDATCGGGHDTLFLATSLWPDHSDAGGHRLLAFDVQEKAIELTRNRLVEAGFSHLIDRGHIRLISDSHENISEYIDTNLADIIVFNLGYLPGGNKSLTTMPESTIKAVQSALHILSKDGLICITIYSGHPAGAQEKETLLQFADGLDSSKYHASYIRMINQHGNPPGILLITRKN